MRNKFLFGAAAVALFAPASAWAQSTGSVELNAEAEATEEVVVTGSRVSQGIEGIQIPDSPKARQVLTNEFLQRGTPGNTVLNALNIVPGVNFTQSDPYGSSGGNIRIRGFDGNRISLTFDGFPLNDTGNYAIFSNQQLDSELVDEINVNLGATDVDSPTASAAGGTINYRTIIPREEMSATGSFTAGEDDFTRAFVLLQSGNLTASGTRLFIAASTASNDKFKGPGRIYKQQFNGGIYQPIGGNGDFIRVSAHYNQNRSNFYRNPSITDLRGAFGTTIIPAATAFSSANPIEVGGNFTGAQEEAIFGIERDRFCARPTPGAGPQNETNTCTNYFNLFQNPSNTGNVRANSRFSLTEKLTLTADVAFQYVLANGGGTSVLAENSARARGGSTTAGGVDFNGDGNFGGTVLVNGVPTFQPDIARFYTPNNTSTRRVTALASLIYRFDDDNLARVAYTYDRGRHRQTGEWGFLDTVGNPENPFGGRNGTDVVTADGFQFQQRDRLSVALLNQVSAEYVGNFFDDAFRVQIGLRAPFFERDLETFCPIEARGSGFAYCTSEPLSTLRVIAPDAVVPTTGATPYFAPFAANYKFDSILPNAGFVYKFSDSLEGVSMFGSYAKGFSSPRTDNLYRAPRVEIDPETTDTFDLGLRYTSRRIQAQAVGWFIGYKNRIVTSFDVDQGISVDRNVGRVESYGADVSVTVRPVDFLALTAFGSYTKSEFQSDVLLGSDASGLQIFAPTRGKQLPETPEYQVGGRAQFSYGGLDVGVQAKYVDERFATDVNDVVVSDYTLVDLDVRYSLESLGLPRTFVQLNVQNVFDEFYFGNISTQTSAGTIGAVQNANGSFTGGIAGANPNFSVGFPRTFTAGVRFEF
ncbi:MAG TPA: TonB-dependent receptor [Sphingomonas sp.]|jgi:iron complex outermembrane receptor protein|uniref:TonB-dependent receptor n=1 Tax=Sphingomonas sp. TaxID=28214 RepID=UPI002ED89D74